MRQHRIGRDKVLICTFLFAGTPWIPHKGLLDVFVGTHCDDRLQHVWGFFFLLFLFLFSFLGCKGCASVRRQRSKKGGRGKKERVEGGEREESTPKPVAAGSHREVPLLFKLPSPSKGRWTDKRNTWAITSTPDSIFLACPPFNFHLVCGIFQCCKKKFAFPKTRDYV